MADDGAGLDGRIALMAQQDLLLPWLSVRDNVLLGHRLRGASRAELRRLREPAAALLARVGLERDADRLPGTLSGGMRQRAALARTLMEDRPIVLMDEPFSALDVVTRHRLQDLAAELLVGRTVLLVTHNPLEALRLGHRDLRPERSPGRPAGAAAATGRAAARRRRPDAAGAAGRASGRADPLGRAPGGVVTLLRPLVTILGLLAAWQALVWATGVPPFILPGPGRVAAALVAQPALLLGHAAITLQEILLGILLGSLIGAASAMLLAASRTAQRWLMPLLVVSQALPVFALAPLLVLWLGYGMPSKVAMAVLIIYFPVTAAFLDGLRRTEPGWLELARTMDARPWAILRHIRVPAALPALTSGLRVAAAVAPIGAVVGEWVGSSAGLGYLMLHANARMQVDLMFAALIVLAAMALLLWLAVDRAGRALVRWQPENLDHSLQGQP